MNNFCLLRQNFPKIGNKIVLPGYTQIYTVIGVDGFTVKLKEEHTNFISPWINWHPPSMRIINE